MDSARAQSSEMSKLDCLIELDWVPVPNYSYLCKYAFYDFGYIIFVTNLTSVFEERMTLTDIEARFTKLNPHIKMKPGVLLERLKTSLERHLSAKSLTLKSEEHMVTISLDFYAGCALSYYNFEISSMPAAKILQYVIGPTILSLFLSRMEVLDLKKSLGENYKPPIPQEMSSVLPCVKPTIQKWHKEKQVPAQVVYDSFMSVQSHLKNVFTENSLVNIASRILNKGTVTTAHTVGPLDTNFESSIKFEKDAELSLENETTAHVVPHKKIKCEESTNNESVIKFEEDDTHSLIKEDESKINVPLSEPAGIAVKKKKEKKVLKF